MTALSLADEVAPALSAAVSQRDATIEIGKERRLRWRQAVPARSAVFGSATPIWVLKAQRAGDATQALALAEGLGLPFEVKDLPRRPMDVLLAPPFVASLAGLTAEAAASLRGPWPLIVVSAGRENEPVARWIKQASGGRTRIVHVGRPWGRVDGYDLVVTTPQYRLPERANVLQNDAPLHRVTAERLRLEAKAWAPRLRHLPRPFVTVLMGGNSGPYALDRRAGERLGREASALARRLGGSLLITTSARTPASALAGLTSSIDVPHYFFGWKPGKTENPYFAFLGLADQIVVTADSMSMIAEACATGKPVHLFDLGEGAYSMRASLGLPGERKPGPRLDPRRWLGEAGLSTAFYRFLVRHLPRRLGRDIRLVHARMVSSGRARWLGDDAVPSATPPLADLDRAVQRVLALFSEGRPATAYSRAA
jgi:mitochondrial fission protein ELM1